MHATLGAVHSLAKLFVVTRAPPCDVRGAGGAEHVHANDELIDALRGPSELLRDGGIRRRRSIAHGDEVLAERLGLAGDSLDALVCAQTPLLDRCEASSALLGAGVHASEVCLEAFVGVLPRISRLPLSLHGGCDQLLHLLQLAVKPSHGAVSSVRDRLRAPNAADAPAGVGNARHRPGHLRLLGEHFLLERGEPPAHGRHVTRHLPLEVIVEGLRRRLQSLAPLAARAARHLLQPIRQL
mmetsp:Transcript_2897/g.8326  ORF Transcript_2897/g.8326 Transcript_2897/m.8326 type:complete len:240 (+) Transcript_2897:1455-2174(+)